MLRRAVRRAQVPPGWVCVYDLSRDREHVAQVQKASRETEEFAFPTRPALFGSRKWWRLIDKGVLPVQRLDGEIIDVYWGSMGDWPEFRMRAADGTEHSLTREGNLRRYVPGLGVSVERVELEGKSSQAMHVLGPTRSVVLSIIVEDSDRRSPAVAPGPGRAGYRVAGGPGARVVYFWAPTTRDAEAIVAQAEVAGGRGRTWTDAMEGAWAALHLPVDFDDFVALKSRAADRGGRYDGYEVVPADGEEPAAYGPSDG